MAKRSGSLVSESTPFASHGFYLPVFVAFPPEGKDPVVSFGRRGAGQSSSASWRIHIQAPLLFLSSENRFRDSESEKFFDVLSRILLESGREVEMNYVSATALLLVGFVLVVVSTIVTSFVFYFVGKNLNIGNPKPISHSDLLTGKYELSAAFRINNKRYVVLNRGGRPKLYEAEVEAQVADNLMVAPIPVSFWTYMEVTPFGGIELTEFRRL